MTVGIYIAIILLLRVVQAFFNKRSSMEIKSIPMLIGYNSYNHSPRHTDKHNAKGEM